MATSFTQSLFGGIDPYKVQRENIQQLFAPITQAQDPYAKIGASLGVLGGMALFGMPKDPRLKLAQEVGTTVQEVMGDTQAGTADFAARLPALQQAFLDKGMADQAMIIQQEIDKQQMAGLEREKIMAQTAKAKAEAEKAGRVSDAGQKGVVLPAGGRIVDSVTGRIIAEGVPQRTETEKTSPESKRYNELIALGVDPERARAIAYKTESVDFRRELQLAKQEENKERKSQQQSNIISTIDSIMNTINTAEKQIGSFTAGTLGSPLSLIPGTSARDLQSNLETIKANLGFDRLQQMRDASPTGGALGQVAIQELVALQSTVASLDNAQSPSQLRANLKKVQGHYQKWRDAVRKAQEQNQTTIGDLQPAQATPATTPQAQPQQPRRLRYNPATQRAE